MIVTFYSFKGGVGRSMALVNVGEILADLGYKVILCDWDLEAPGLERYMAADPGEAADFVARKGLMDLLIEYKQTLATPQDLHKDSPPAGVSTETHWPVGRLQLRRPSNYAFPVSTLRTRSGSVRLLTAGSRGGDDYRKYAENVRTFDWEEFYDKWAGDSYIDFVRAELSRAAVLPGSDGSPSEAEREIPAPQSPAGEADIVLVDSRTGVTEQGGVCTHHLADLVVLFSAANGLNIEGTRWMAGMLSNPQLSELRGGRPLQILVTATRIEQSSEKNLLTEFRSRFAAEFSRYVPQALGDPGQFLYASEIPYMPFYSFTERVAAREPEGERERRMHDAYSVLTQGIVRCGIAAGLLREPLQGNQIERAPLRTEHTEPPKGLFVLTHTTADHSIATALADGLRAAGVQVWLGGSSNEPAFSSKQLQETLAGSAGVIILVGEGAERWVRAQFDDAVKRQALQPDFAIVPVLQPGMTAKNVPPLLTRVRLLSLPDRPAPGDEVFRALMAELGARTSALQEDPTQCPFRGFEPFEEEHARFFFGRDAETWDAVRRLGTTPSRWLQIVGSNGVGKSSLARAGVVPAIRRGWLDSGQKEWTIVVCRPTGDSIASLSSAIADRASGVSAADLDARLRAGDNALADIVRTLTPRGQSFLLVIDQLEDVFIGGSADSHTLEQFDRLLAAALTDTALSFYLVTTIRVDFLPRVELLPKLRSLLSESGRCELKPMDAGGLRQAAAGPAKLAGLFWERGLLERVVADGLESRQALSLFSQALMELWTKRTGNFLTNGAYQQVGGPLGVLGRSIEQLCDRLTPEDRERTKGLLLRLVKVSRNSADTVRTISRREAVAAAGGDDEGERILKHLSAPPQLIKVSDDRVELVHERLIRHSRTLSRWIDDERDALKRAGDLDAAVAAWEAAGRPDSGLPVGQQLAYFRTVPLPSEPAREFLESAELRERRLQALAAAGRRNWWARAALLLLTLAATALGGIGIWRLQQRRHQADDGAISAQRTQDENPLRGLALAITAARQAETDETTSALQRALQYQYPRAILQHNAAVSDVSVSADNALVVTASFDATARVWNAGTGQPVGAPLTHADQVVTARFSPDKQRVVTASFDKTARVWDTATGQMVAALEGHTGPLAAAEFSRDGRSLVTASFDGTALIWNAGTFQIAAELRGHSGPVAWADFAPDGRSLLTVSFDGTGRLWQADSGALLAVLEGHTAPVVSAAFSHDGRFLATASFDGTVRRWEMPVALPTSRPGGQAASTPDGGLVTSRLGRAVSPPSRRLPSIRMTAPEQGRFSSVNFSPDDRWVLGTTDGGPATLWDAKTGEIVRSLIAPPDAAEAVSAWITSAAFSTDGNNIAAASTDGTVRIWDRATGREIATLRGHSAPIRRVLFSADGRWLLTGSDDGTAEIWDSQRPTITSSSSFADLLRTAEASLPVTLTEGDRQQLAR